MKNKNLFQEKITRLESTLNVVGRAMSLNDRDQAFQHLEKAKEVLSDMQSMLNREEEYYN
jgi:prephenate dehydrogenase